jgi:hypothetical protein
MYNDSKPAPPSTSPGPLKAETKVGLGVGLGIGIPALIVIGALLWILRKRAGGVQQVQSGSPSHDEAVVKERAELHNNALPYELDGRTHPRPGE